MTLDFKPNHDLQPGNSLAVPSRCRWFVSITDKQQLANAVIFSRDNALPLFVLGSGTNVVLGEFLDAVVAGIAIPGKQVLSKDSRSALVEVGAGEDWHQFVVWCMEQKLYGLENLALIPGTCGAAPIQNIGAYGVELSELIESVEIFDTAEQQFKRLTKNQCELSYRDSIFKQDLKNRAVVVSIRLNLGVESETRLEYPALADYMKQNQLEATPQNVFESVCAIRRSKLPDPTQIPNVGSFFKNPVVDEELAASLQERYPEMPCYPVSEEWVKIPAAWLIDSAGWKGWHRNGVGVHAQQALVLVNPGNKKAEEILQLADKISTTVRSEFGVDLEIEPRVFV